MKDKEFPVVKPKFFVRLPDTHIYEHHGKILKFIRVGWQSSKKYEQIPWRYNFELTFKVWRLRPSVQLDWMRKKR